MKKKNFLVTGGTGFIGTGICKLLINLGHKVSVFDNNSRGKISRISSFEKKIKFISGDIRDRKKVFSSLKKIDAVIHLAYINGTKFFYEKPEIILDVAVKGLVNILDGCIKYKIKELYLASSSEVYQTPSKIPTDENESLKVPNVFNPRYSYGGGKILTELMGVHYGKKYFKKLIIFRPHNVYGPDMGNEHVIPEIIRKFKNLKGKNLKIQGSGNEIRSFIYIDDFVQAFNLLLKKGKHLEIYNIGTTDKIKIKKLVLKISNILKKKIILKKTSLRIGGTKKRLPDIKKLRKLGFKQKVKIDQGLKKSIDFYF